MEAGSATPMPARTGSRTIADLLPRAAAIFAHRTAVRHKVGGDWRDVTFAEAGDVAREIALGLISLGLRPGQRVALLSSTRPEWSYTDFAVAMAGGVVVPIYATSSPEECEWVLADSGAVAVVFENAGQLAKVAAVRERLPALRHAIVVDPAGAPAGTPTLAELRAEGRGRDGAELDARTAAVAPEQPYTIIYTSGTTGPPKGCVLNHANYRAIVDMAGRRQALEGTDDVVYLYLPLAHSFARLIQLAAFDRGTAIAYFGGDTAQIVAELSECRPTHLPSVPRIFEKIHALVCANVDAATLTRATEVGGRVQDLRVAGRPVPADLQQAHDAFDARLFANVRAAFGGRLREAVTGAAPIAPEILSFFWACGVPVMEGYGLTETATAATVSTPEHHRFGTVGRALPGVDIRIAGDGEVLIRGANVFRGYHGDADASSGTVVDGWLHTGDLGTLDADGYLSITGRKKDIIITAGGTNLTPANVENDLRRSRWISQAVMHGDRRPFPSMLVTLDEEEIVPWAREHGIGDTATAALAHDPQVIALVQAELDRVNARYARAERVKRFFILDHDLSQETGELTPTLKVRRAVVEELYADRFDALYA